MFATCMHMYTRLVFLELLNYAFECAGKKKKKKEREIKGKKRKKRGLFLTIMFAVHGCVMTGGQG